MFFSYSLALIRPTENEKIFTWTSDCQDAFKILKNVLWSALILAYLTSFIVDSKNSKSGFEGEEHVIAYFNKNLSKAERNY